MSISYPLTLPTTSGIARVSMQYQAVNALVMSPNTLQQQVQEFEGECFLAEVALPIQSKDEAGAWRAFLCSLQGVKGTFMLGDPLNTSPQGTAPGAPKVDGASQTGRELATKGWTASQEGVLLAGDWIQVGQRLHMVLVDADSDGSGDATLDICPALRESPADNDTIITENAKGLFRLTSNTVSILETMGDILVYEVRFSAIEAL